MTFPIIPVVATAAVGGLGLLLFGDKKKTAAAEEPKQGQGVDLPSKSAPIPVNLPTIPISKLPTGTVSGKVIAKSGLNVRAEPNTGGKQLTLCPFGASLIILNPSSKLPATSGAPMGWWKVRTTTGIEGFASAEFIAIGGVSPNLPTPVKTLPRAPISLPKVPLPIPGPLPNVVIPPAPSPSATTATVTAPSGLNLRSTPNTSGNIRTTVPFGKTVVVVNSNIQPATSGAPKGWLEVSYNGVTGYGSAEWLSNGNVPAPQKDGTWDDSGRLVPREISITGTVTAKNGLNIRNQANTTGTVLATMPLNSKLTILDPVPSAPTTGAPYGWLRVSTSTGITGYASAEFVQFNTPNVTGEDIYSMGEYFTAGAEEALGGLSRTGKNKYSLIG